MQGLWQNLSSNKFIFSAFGVVDLWINQNDWEFHIYANSLGTQ